jgi:hypothetical protein
MGGATMGGHGHIFFIKNRSLVGWGEGWDSLKSHMCYKLWNFATKC